MQRLNPRLSPYNLAVFKQNHGRNTPDLVLSGGRLRFIYVDFNDSNLIADALSELFQNGRLLFAGTAPVSIEVDQHGLIAVNKIFE